VQSVNTASDTVEKLRARIRELEGRPAAVRAWDPTGWAAWDQAVGGLPCAGVVEMEEGDSAGRTHAALCLVAALCRQGTVAWVDAPRELYPPAAARLGVDLTRLVLLRPEVEHTAWVVEQALRAGCFRAVVADPQVVIQGALARWTRASNLGQTPLVWLSPARAWAAGEGGRIGAPDPSVSVRMRVCQQELVVQRHRNGQPGRGLPLLREVA
jgi:hypothetical protein